MSKKRYVITATTYDRKGHVIAKAVNSYVKTHPRMAMLAERVGAIKKNTLHAEVLAIIRSKGRPIHKIKVERYDLDGNPKLAQPCSICMEAIREAGIKFVEFTVG